jgi:hypothetical protein
LTCVCVYAFACLFRLRQAIEESRGGAAGEDDDRDIAAELFKTLDVSEDELNQV